MSSWYQTSFPCIRVFGPDACSWLNAIVTCDVTSTQSGKAVWGTLLTKQGKIQLEFFAVAESDSIYLSVAGGDADRALTTLDGFLVMEDAEIEFAERTFLFQLNEGEETLDEVLGLVGHELEHFGKNTVVYSLNPAQLAALHDRQEIKWWSTVEFDAFRVQQGIVRYGVDYDEGDNLHSASLERKVVDWSKGCYLGQEVVCMQEMRGKVRKRIVSLLAEGDTSELDKNVPFEVQNEAGDVVGLCTSLIAGHGLAKVRAPEDSSGTRLACAGTAASFTVRA